MLLRAPHYQRRVWPLPPFDNGHRLLLLFIKVPVCLSLRYPGLEYVQAACSDPFRSAACTKNEASIKIWKMWPRRVNLENVLVLLTPTFALQKWGICQDTGFLVRPRFEQPCRHS